MSGVEIGVLIIAGAVVVLVLVLIRPLWKLGGTIDAATQTIKDIDKQIVPILGNVNATVDNVNTALVQVHSSLDGVNIQLERLDTITNHAQAVTANVANISSIVGAAASSPLVKVAAFGYGLRKTVSQRKAADEDREVRGEIKARKAAAKSSRRSGRHAKGA
ncbi:MAG TPA: DUF948 domain-containing protein [Phytomonospora sp.]